MDFLHFYPSLSTTAIGTPVKPSGEFGPVEVQTEGCVSWKQGRLSPGSVARSIKKITPELLTITEPEVSFRTRGPTAVGEGVLPDDLSRLDRRVRNGAADRTNRDHRHSDGSSGSDEQLRNVASHDRLPSMNSIAAAYGRRVLKDVMGITKRAVSVSPAARKTSRVPWAAICAAPNEWTEMVLL